MNVTFLPSSCAGESSSQYLTSYLINDAIAIDAGSLGFWRTPADQAAVRHVLISHSHIDHVASLPIFLENVAAFHASPVKIYASEAVQDSLRRDLFNGRVWADFLRLTHERGRFADMVTIESGHPLEIEGLRVTPIAMDHVVPTLGFLLEDVASAVVIASDTSPTHEIWTLANRTSHLKAVFLEATFPNEMAPLAELTKHLTSAQFHAEMHKVTRPARFYAVHLRARCREQVERELLSAGLPHLEIAKFGKTYMF